MSPSPIKTAAARIVRTAPTSPLRAVSDRDTAGTDPARTDPAGTTAAGIDRAGIDRAGSDRAGSDTGATDLADIEQLERSIDTLDGEILDAVRRRAELSALIGRAREASGAPRFIHSREMDVLHHFTELGSEGHTLAMLLLRLGRHRLAG